jgi:DNA (cytosine-5)-methyltransferase 1
MRVMSLFAGYGGLDLALGMVFPEARTVYVSDIEEGPCRVLAHRFPEATNLGDVTAVDWDSLDPVDVVIGGSPCPDLSDAGRGAGMRPGTRSGLWSSMVDAIAATRPRLVVWENVRGALSKSAFSRLESGEGRMGGRADGVVLRALGRVLGDLSALGYDCQWSTFRASTIGAPHQRERVFVVAVPSSQGWRLPWHTVTREAACGWASALDSGRAGASLTLLPTPTTQDGKNNGGPSQFERNTPPLNTVVKMPSFGDYVPAITRWEQVIGRTAPSPTIPSPAGKPRLSHHFTEWMMGLPEGWICDPALWVDYPPTKARSLCLRMAGNGVVPQQAAWAIHALLNRATALAAGIGL